jgi:hypothetical protein
MRISKRNIRRCTTKSCCAWIKPPATARNDLEHLNGTLLMMANNQEPLGRKLNRCGKGFAV